MTYTARRSLIGAVSAPFLACLLILVACPVRSDGSASSVAWSASVPLTWSLFQCTPPADAVHRSEAAAIHMTIDWHARFSLTSNGSDWIGHVQSVTVANTMEPSLSWVVPGKETLSILRHEQAHFDLNEVYRRKLEFVLPCLPSQRGAKQGVIDALTAAARQRASEVLSRLEATQARYDAETSYGRDSSAQARWEAQIAAWLDHPTEAP